MVTYNFDWSLRQERECRVFPLSPLHARAPLIFCPIDVAIPLGTFNATQSSPPSARTPSPIPSVAFPRVFGREVSIPNIVYTSARTWSRLYLRA